MYEPLILFNIGIFCVEKKGMVKKSPKTNSEPEASQKK